MTEVQHLPPFRMVMDSIEEHRRTYTPGIVRDMVDYYIAAQEERGFNETAFVSEYRQQSI